MTASNQYDAEDTAADGSGDESMSYFDADGYLHHSESRELDYFDAMEVIYMLEAEESPSTSGAEEDNDGSKGRRKKLRKLAHAKRKLLQEELRTRRRKLKQKLSEPTVVLTIDKISFVCGVLNLVVTEAVLLLHPEKMGLLYTALLIPLMVARYILYRADKYHYFMYGECWFKLYQKKNCIPSIHTYSSTLHQTSATSPKS